MRTGLIYLLCIALAIGIIHLVIRYGNGLVAPTALPGAWSFHATAAPACPLFPSEQGVFRLSQSGETLSVTFHQSESFELHGKVRRDGGFQLNGKIPRGRFAACIQGSLRWEGHADPKEMNGDFSIGGGDCAPCAGDIQVSGVPEK